MIQKLKFTVFDRTERIIVPAPAPGALRPCTILTDPDAIVRGRAVRSVSVATAEGYMPIACASGYDGGSMGIHYVNEGQLKDDAIDLAHPETVMYEPSADGKLTLIGVEYITFKGPAELNGHLFSFNSAPNRYGLGPFYELHVWAWKKNRTGAFADMNPDVSCDAVTSAK